MSTLAPARDWILNPGPITYEGAAYRLLFSAGENTVNAADDGALVAVFEGCVWSDVTRWKTEGVPPGEIANRLAARIVGDGYEVEFTSGARASGRPPVEINNEDRCVFIQQSSDDAEQIERLADALKATGHATADRLKYAPPEVAEDRAAEAEEISARLFGDVRRLAQAVACPHCEKPYRNRSAFERHLRKRLCGAPEGACLPAGRIGMDAPATAVQGG